MKIALAQINYTIGDFKYNKGRIIETIEKAKRDQADLVVFSELSVCGYPPQDMLEHKKFINKSYQSIETIAPYCQNIAAIIGAPSLNPDQKGKPLFNSAYVLFDGKIQKIQHKTLLPTYDIFDEYRYFESNTDFNILAYKGKKIALTICEDLWDEQPTDTPLSRSNLYKVTPMEELSHYKPDFIINIAASPFSSSRIKSKKEIFRQKAKRYQMPLVYVNQVGANTELIFEGESMLINEEGDIVCEMASFAEDYQLIDIEHKNTSPLLSQKTEGLKDKTAQIHDALLLGIKDFFRKQHFTKATLGLSGGIDSAITCALASEALGPENIHVLLLPSPYSSGHSIDDSVQLAKNLGVKYDTLRIDPVFKEFQQLLKPLFKDMPEDTTEENIQARIRSVLLMALSNKFGYILLNTSNKSEAAVGYSTLYGDMAGGLSVLGDVYKTELYQLAHYLNRDTEIIPNNIITKAPSAELRPEQKDSDSLPDYELLDQILFRYIEQHKSPEEIATEGYDHDLITKIINLINKNEYKRYQAPPMLRISSKAFGIGRRMPLVARF